MPNAAQVLVSGKRDWLEFSSSVREVAAARMDIVRYGRSRDIGDALTSVRAGEEDVWLVLWDMLRGLQP